MPRSTNLSPNMSAFLDMIAFSEGTADHGDDGYNVIVGGSLFNNYDDHPRELIDLPRLGIKSTAAGRYQLLARYYDAYKSQLDLPDFSPESQDAIAVKQIHERGAIDDIDEGRFAVAVSKVHNIWASLPGAGYQQHENTIERLQEAYERAGGVVA